MVGNARQIRDYPCGHVAKLALLFPDWSFFGRRQTPGHGVRARPRYAARLSPLHTRLPVWCLPYNEARPALLWVNCFLRYSPHAEKDLTSGYASISPGYLVRGDAVVLFVGICAGRYEKAHTFAPIHARSPLNGFPFIGVIATVGIAPRPQQNLQGCAVPVCGGEFYRRLMKPVRLVYVGSSINEDACNFSSSQGCCIRKRCGDTQVVGYGRPDVHT